MQKSLIVAAVVLTALYLMGISRPALAAETDTYPYSDMPCVHAPFARQGAQAQWCPDYDWGTRANNQSASSVISPYGYYYRNCTDYVAWRLAGAGVPSQQYRGLGDAKQWGLRAAGKGERVDAVPLAGSVGVRTTGKYGHVAIVEEVLSGGRIRVAQYNLAGDGVFSTAIGTPQSLGLSQFVHFQRQPQPAAAVLLTAAEPPPITTSDPASAASQATVAASAPLVDGTVATPELESSRLPETHQPVASIAPATHLGDAQATATDASRQETKAAENSPTPQNHSAIDGVSVLKLPVMQVEVALPEASAAVPADPKPAVSPVVVTSVASPPVIAAATSLLPMQPVHLHPHSMPTTVPYVLSVETSVSAAIIVTLSAIALSMQSYYRLEAWPVVYVRSFGIAWARRMTCKIANCRF